MTAILKDSRILVVDDSILMRQLLAGILTDMGFRKIDGAANGLEAIEIVRDGRMKSNPVRVIFLDWAMPEMDGLAYLKMCRADPQMAGIPIVMVTAVSEQSQVLEAVRAGATAYIVKPFAPEKVAETMKTVSIWAEKHG